jgi:serine/threonine protein kinase
MEKHCQCGLPVVPGEELCERCKGDKVIHVEGEILKKTREGKLKKYWFNLLDKELYFYKNKDDERHKGMHSLVGVFIKDELEEFLDKKTVLYPFKLIFPNKARIYYLLSKTEKDKWMNAIKKAIGYSNLFDFYELQENLGKGKFGLVRAATHKKTGKKVAVKVMKKKDMTVADMELQKREIEILKICQHPNIIRLLDIFENQDYIYIGKELVSDVFSNGSTFRRRSFFILGEEELQNIRRQSQNDFSLFGHCSLLST